MALKAFATSTQAMSIDYALGKGVDIINFSCVCSSSLLEAAIQKAYHDSGKVVTAAAGNWYQSFVHKPAVYDETIAVGGFHPDYKRYGNYGEQIDLLGPPGNVVVMDYDSQNGHIYALGGGTSIASPTVAGAIAGIWSQFPGESNVAIRQRMAATAVNVDAYNSAVFAGNSGRGVPHMLNAFQATDLFSFEFLNKIVLNDNDGRVTPGEAVELDIRIKNSGEAMYSIHATLNSDDPHISVLQDTASFPNMDFMALATSLTPFQIAISGLPEPGYIAKLTLTLSFNNMPENNKTVDFFMLLEDPYHSFFPSPVTGDGNAFSWDIDEDGKDDFLPISKSGRYLNLFRYNQPVTTYFFGGSDDVLPAIAVGNIDTDPEKELIILQKPDIMHLLHFENNQLLADHIPVNTGVNFTGLEVPVLANLDKDIAAEVLIKDNNALVALDYDPQTTVFQTLWVKSLPAVQIPTVADINQDGEAEIIVAHGNTLSVLDRNGNLLYSRNDGLKISTPTVANVHGDEYLEIVYNAVQSDNKNQLHIAESHLLSSTVSQQLFSSAASLNIPLIAYNLDNDPLLEIIFTHNQETLLLQAAPFNSFQYLNPIYNTAKGMPIIVNLTEYETPLILQNARSDGINYTFAWDGYSNFPFNAGNENMLYTYSETPNGAPAFLDFDGDQSLDLGLNGTSESTIVDGSNFLQLKETHLTWQRPHHDARNNKLLAQHFNEAFSPAPAADTIVWSYGPETPVILSGVITVPAAKTLLIAPGSRVLFNPGHACGWMATLSPGARRRIPSIFNLLRTIRRKKAWACIL